jgi:hypothetical protein
MSTITITRNGGLSQAYQKLKEQDAEKQAILEAEKKAAEEKKLAKIAKAEKAAAAREKKLAEKVECGDACSRCYRADRKDICGTHTDDECQKAFCEECYAYAQAHATGSRKFVTHETSDCEYAIRRAQRQYEQELEERQRKLDLEMESEGAMLRRLKREKVKAFRAEKEAQKAVQAVEAKSTPKVVQLKPIVLQDAVPIGAEATAIWQKKTAETIAEHQKKLDEAKAAEEARIAEEIATAKKLAEDKIAEKKARLDALRAKFREAKAKAEDKKVSNTQKKKSQKEAIRAEKDAKSLTIEIDFDTRLLRDLLKSKKHAQ